eukprot:6990624-Prymnesium_polylepis.1
MPLSDLRCSTLRLTALAYHHRKTLICCGRVLGCGGCRRPDPRRDRRRASAARLCERAVSRLLTCIP